MSYPAPQLTLTVVLNGRATPARKLPDNLQRIEVPDCKCRIVWVPCDCRERQTTGVCGHFTCDCTERWKKEKCGCRVKIGPPCPHFVVWAESPRIREWLDRLDAGEREEIAAVIEGRHPQLPSGYLPLRNWIHLLLSRNPKDYRVLPMPAAPAMATLRRKQRVAVMRQRVQSGLSAFHPQDAWNRLPDYLRLGRHADRLINGHDEEDEELVPLDTTEEEDEE